MSSLPLLPSQESMSCGIRIALQPRFSERQSWEAIVEQFSSSTTSSPTTTMGWLDMRRSKLKQRRSSDLSTQPRDGKVKRQRMDRDPMSSSPPEHPTMYASLNATSTTTTTLFADSSHTPRTPPTSSNPQGAIAVSPSNVGIEWINDYRVTTPSHTTQPSQIPYLPTLETQAAESSMSRLVLKPRLSSRIKW